MKFFIDFESTRFIQHIISIGCVSENGKEFYSLIKPSSKKIKIDNFIAELTGITDKMLENAPSANEVFSNLFDFIIENSDNEKPEFYCYGESDEDFISSTLNYINDSKAYICASAIKSNLINYAEIVKKFFEAKSNIALRKIYSLIQTKNELNKEHNALEDAKMLQIVENNLKSKCSLEDKSVIVAMPSTRIYPKGEGKKAPEIFQIWNSFTAWTADTLADETSWKIRAYNKNADKYKYFDSIDTAVLWAIKFCSTGLSPKREKDVNKVKEAIEQSITIKKFRYNCLWESRN